MTLFDIGGIAIVAMTVGDAIQGHVFRWLHGAVITAGVLFVIGDHAF